ncbi:hypothetical protein Gogos_005451 [Gossypium gossypioides]|uniref:RNase H type-1 domain-containing protein n=1 Tax=Gossypium gossypioides TaxID=34282 RepID=A0A7J9CZJ2_GOSGO|nr:hypothetical protein [Gossypium gossypioides]
MREQICKIPIIPNAPNGRKGWFHNPHGYYTSKSAYSWLLLKQIGYGPHQCPNAREILAVGGLNDKLLDGEYTSWNNKNNFISRGKEEEARIVSERASSLSKEFRIHNLTNKPILPVTPVEMNRVKPQNGIIKINFDATIAPTIMGYGIIARDWDGFVLGGSEGFIESGMEADWAELRAFEESINFRKKFNFKDVQFELDSAGLVNRINNSDKDLTMMGHRLKEVCPHLRDFNSSYYLG